MLGTLRQEKGQRVLTFPGDRLLCACNDKIRDFVLAKRGERLPTVREIYAGVWPSEWVLSGAGSFMWVSQANSEMPFSMPLLKRNGPVVGAGTYTQASGMVSDHPVHTQWRETNEELCILLRQGDVLKRVLFVPPAIEIANRGEFLGKLKTDLDKQEGHIRAQLPASFSGMPMEFIDVHPTYLANKSCEIERLVIELPDSEPSQWQGQVFYVPEKYTVNLHSVMHAVLPEGELLQVDPEGFRRETKFVTQEELLASGFPRIYALEDYAQSLSQNYVTKLSTVLSLSNSSSPVNACKIA